MHTHRFHAQWQFIGSCYCCTRSDYSLFRIYIGIPFMHAYIIHLLVYSLVICSKWCTDCSVIPACALENLERTYGEHAEHYFHFCTTCAEEVNSRALTSLASLNSEIRAEPQHASPHHVLPSSSQIIAESSSVFWEVLAGGEQVGKAGQGVFTVPAAAVGCRALPDCLSVRMRKARIERRVRETAHGSARCRFFHARAPFSFHLMMQSRLFGEAY